MGNGTGNGSACVDGMITDAVTQTGVGVMGEAPALALASLYQSMAHSNGILFQNAVAAAAQQMTLSQAATNQGVMQIYSVNTMAGASATEKIMESGSLDELTTLLSTLTTLQR